MSEQKYTIENFKSKGDTCSGWFFKPNKDLFAKTAVIMAHGFSAEKTWNLPVFAEHFQSRGLATLLFDYRTCGESSGSPRNFLSPSAQVHDYEAAIEHCKVNLGIDKFILWGVSFSGGHVINVASKRVSGILAVCALVPHLSPLPAISKLGISRLAGVGALALFAELKYRILNEEFEIPITAPPGKPGFLTFPGWHKEITRYVKENPNFWENKMPVRLLLEMLSYAPILKAKDVACPVQFVYGVHDNGIDPGSIRSAAAKIKYSETVSLTINHFEGLNRFYRDRIASMQMDFIERRTLGAP
jgi:uncharacterized protein